MQTSIKNISGNNKIKQKGTINFFKNLPPLTFYEYKFHDFFDGILGSETLAKLNSKIDFKTETLHLNKEIFKYSKFYPSKTANYHQTVTLETSNNGDWFVPQFQELSDKIFITPGLYRAKNLKTTVNVICSEKNIHELPKLRLTVNNFETLDPIPVELTHKLNLNDIEKLIRVDHLSKLEKLDLIKLLHENQQVLLREGEKLSSTTAIKHKIITSDNIPVYTKSYRYPHHFRKDVEEQIQELIDNGIITHSVSPYSSPIWVVPKKTDASGKKKIRVVIDYRKLNDKTVDDKYPMPQIEDILDHLGKSTYFTTLDL